MRLRDVLCTPQLGRGLTDVVELMILTTYPEMAGYL